MTLSYVRGVSVIALRYGIVRNCKIVNCKIIRAVVSACPVIFRVIDSYGNTLLQVSNTNSSSDSGENLK